MNGTPRPSSWTELSGRLFEGCHFLPIRVYFEDTDFSGAVYHTSYLRWCERGRSDYLRLLGISHRKLASGEFAGDPCAFAVRRISADFLKPTRIDEILEVRTRAGQITKASITLEQSIARENQTVFRLTAQCVLVSFSGRLLRFPSSVAAPFRESGGRAPE